MAWLIEELKQELSVLSVGGAGEGRQHLFFIFRGIGSHQFLAKKRHDLNSISEKSLQG